MISQNRITDPSSPRGKLLASAAKLFKKKGYSKTTVRDLAAEVSILSGSIFHHFKNKDEILFAVMNEVVIAMDEALKSEIKKAHTTLDKIRVLIYIELQFIHGKTSNATAVLLHEWRALIPEKQQQILSSRADYFQLWDEVLIQAKSEGLIEVEPEYLRHFLHGALTWTSHWYQAGGELSIDGLTDRVLILALKNNIDQ
ncbi:TetR/AcrR family transcriptional regulator [Thalassotalea psychrophila]|uniref:TetR/AcrR family transcriptional regulator n=1 Tax=Thalassotalea psychrophila TaxID=3065647 RepID=A0ABY9U142_9GAMM|nr:TetR/AcrR family transcriptional regulator [Colwelliaceae bacterium SQ149]